MTLIIRLIDRGDQELSEMLLIVVIGRLEGKISATTNGNMVHLRWLCSREFLMRQRQKTEDARLNRFTPSKVLQSASDHDFLPPSFAFFSVRCCNQEVYDDYVQADALLASLLLQSRRHHQRRPSYKKSFEKSP